MSDIVVKIPIRVSKESISKAISEALNTQSIELELNITVKPITTKKEQARDLF